MSDLLNYAGFAPGGFVAKAFIWGILALLWAGVLCLLGAADRLHRK